MKIGTKSVLFGAHCFILHPWFVAAAWWRIFGFPFDPRLWVAFLGETHVELGARIMGFLFGREWGTFYRYHSRFYAKKDNVTPSRLCIADKLAIAITPAWLYLPLVRATGEIHEYMALAVKRNLAGEGKYACMNLGTNDQREWYADVQRYVFRWVEEHKDGREDTWTPKTQNEGADMSSINDFAMRQAWREHDEEMRHGKKRMQELDALIAQSEERGPGRPIGQFDPEARKAKMEATAAKMRERWLNRGRRREK